MFAKDTIKALMADGEKLRQLTSEDHGPFENTDRELWREPDKGNGSFYSDSIHVTQGGSIGMNCGGYVLIMPIRRWHEIAKAHLETLKP